MLLVRDRTKRIKTDHNIKSLSKNRINTNSVNNEDDNYN